MKHCRHMNIIQIYDVYCRNETSRTNVAKTNMGSIYAVMEYMEFTLKQFYEKFELSLDQVSFVVYQMSCALKFMHDLGIWHRDLKPENIGVDMNLTVKIFDFGLARADVDPNKTRLHQLTRYIMTRHYRAPEVILNLEYNHMVDIWSLGCILGELVFKEILFKGSDETHQLTEIIRKLGVPPPAMLQRVEPIKTFLERLLHDQNAAGVNYDILADIRSRESSNDDSISRVHAADCLQKMLKIDPSERIDGPTLLDHPFLENYRWMNAEVVPSEELVAQVKKFQRNFNNSECGVDWNDTIYRLMQTWHSNDLNVENNGTDDISPFRPPKPLHFQEIPATSVSSSLLILSPLFALLAGYMTKRYVANSTLKQCVITGSIVLVSTYAVSVIFRSKKP